MPSRRKVQELIGEVARRHSVLLEAGDPIFVAVTLNELLLVDHLETVQALVEDVQRSAEATWQRQTESARLAAKLLLDGGAKQVADQLRAACDPLQRRLEGLVAECLQRAHADAVEAARNRRRSEVAAAVAAASAVLAVAMVATKVWFR